MCTCTSGSVCASCKTLLDLIEYYEKRVKAYQLEVDALKSIIVTLQKQLE